MGSSPAKLSGDVARLGIGEPGFPACLASIPAPPQVIYVCGRLPPAPRVALVGSRDADGYGLKLATELGAGLARAGVCVVSGGAGGVDTAALQGCLEGGGSPVAVLGTGVDVVYPAANRSLFMQVAVRGALVSEYPLGTPGRPSQFPQRNRIVSGLSEGVVLVRAAAKSGSLITAREAVRQGRVLMAVPGRAGEPLSAGVHQMIRRGALLVESADDILRALSISQPQQPSLNLANRPEELDADERLLLDVLGGGGCAVDVLTSRTGLPAGQISSLLLQMELKGLVFQKPGMVYCLTPEGKASSGRGDEGASSSWQNGC